MSVRGAEWIDDSPQEEISDNSHGSRQKPVSKKRKVLSCYACRNRKLRCDRRYPVCGRCEKTGRSGQCKYDPRLIEESNVHVTANISSLEATNNGGTIGAPKDLESRIELHERRIRALESDLAAGRLSSAPSRYNNLALKQPEVPEEMVFSSKGFKTSFHGATSIISSIERFPELQVFAQKTSSVDQSVVAGLREIHDTRKRLAIERIGRSHNIEADVYRALPDETFIKSQAVLYFDTWESTYRILHKTSFWQESDGFWEQRRNGKGSAAFAVILILIVAIMKCASRKEDVFVGDTTADREDAADLIKICAAWLGQQSRRRITLSFFQIQCLSLLAKRTNCIEMKQDWVNSGELVRLAMASGMHRDPDLITAGKVSAYEKEMRKRLWATIMELELQSSIETGLQSSLTDLYYDTPRPINLSDEDFSIESEQLPAPQLPEHFTSASYLRLSQLSLHLRIHLTQLLNNPLKDLQYLDILHYDGKIHAAIASLPRWDEMQAEIPSALLHLQLQQYLLLLHKSYARQARQNSQYTHSLITTIDTASSMMATYSAMTSRGILALSHFRNDILRVGIIISGIIFENCLRIEVKPNLPAYQGAQSRLTEPEPHLSDVRGPMQWMKSDKSLHVAVLPNDTSLLRTSCITSLELLERTRQLYEQKVIRLGTGYMEYWLLLSAIGILPELPSSYTATDHPSITNDHIVAKCRRTLDHFTALKSHILARQTNRQTSPASSLKKPVDIMPSSDRHSLCVGKTLVDDSDTTPLMSNPLPFGVTSEAELAVGEDMEDPFTIFQDMQINLGEWSFPDFWGFDLGTEL